MNHQRGGGSSAYHCGHAPDIGAGTPFRPENDLGRPVLPRLDIVREVVVDPAGVAEVRNFNADDIERVRIIRLPLLAGRSRGVTRLVKRDARHLAAKKVP